MRGICDLSSIERHSVTTTDICQGDRPGDFYPPHPPGSVRLHDVSDKPAPNRWKADLETWLAEGRSLRDFARKIDASDNQVYGWKNGRTRPRDHWQRRFADEMGRSVEYYLDGSPHAGATGSGSGIPEAAAVVLAEVVDRLGSAQNALRYLLDGDDVQSVGALDPEPASRTRSREGRRDPSSPQQHGTA